MRTISDRKIREIIEVLKSTDNAINILERANNNRMLFSTTKDAAQKLIQELEIRYTVKDIKIEGNE